MAKVFKNYQGGIDPSTLPQKYKKNDTVTNGVNDNIMDWTSWNINDIFFPPAYARIVGGGLHVRDNMSGFSWTMPEYIFRVQDGIVLGIKVNKTLQQADQNVGLLQRANQPSKPVTQAIIGSGSLIGGSDDMMTTSGDQVTGIGVYVDINGSKSPNIVGKDLYYFTLSEKNKFTEMSGFLNTGACGGSGFITDDDMATEMP